MSEQDLQRQIVQLQRETERLRNRVSGPTLGELYGMFLGLPALRAFWPFSSYDEGGNIHDLSGQGRKLAPTNGPTIGTQGLVPYFNYNGTNQYYARADEAGLDITGGLTIGGWFYVTSTDAGGKGLIGKYNTTGNQRSYLLYVLGASFPTTPRFITSSDGTNTGGTGQAYTVVSGRWYFMVGRYTPSTEIALFVNESKSAETTSIPASTFSGTADLQVMAFTQGGVLTAGRSTLCFLCAVELSDTLINYLFQRSRVFFGV